MFRFRGADSDIVLDICTKVDIDHKIKYVWFDTGLEYQATKDHLRYLENKYGIKILTYKAVKPIPTTCKEYGQPFLSKFVSSHISRLQKNGFKWEDEPLDKLVEKYPKCISSLKWWCNMASRRYNIEYNKWLKEFMVQNPPHFPISDKCCDFAKKQVAHSCEKEFNADLRITGIRKGEGGIRSVAYKSCFETTGSIDRYMPVFWYLDAHKKLYCEHLNIVHSKCYTEYGMERTGCAGCPFGIGASVELALEKTEIHEPKLYQAILNIFGDSYEYTRKYREFYNKMEYFKDISDKKVKKPDKPRFVLSMLSINKRR